MDDEILFKVEEIEAIFEILKNLNFGVIEAKAISLIAIRYLEVIKEIKLLMIENIKENAIPNVQG